MKISLEIQSEEIGFTLDKVVAGDVVVLDWTDRPIHVDEPEVEMCTLTLVAENTNESYATGGGTYPKGTEVTVTAVCVGIDEFDCWSTGETETTIKIIVDQNCTLRAYFYPHVE